MPMFESITFFEVCITLVTLAVAERAIVQYLPETVVGPEGWLLKTKG